MRNYYQPIVTLLLIFSLTGCGSSPETSRTEIASPVSVTEIKPGSISKIFNTSATARAMKEVDLNSQMTGDYRLQRNSATGAAFKLGDRVTEGQTIIRLEDKEFENSQAIDVKEMTLTRAKENVEKQKILFENGGVTSSEILDAELSVKNAEYSYENALISLGNMTIKAPITGYVVNLPYYTPGSRVSSGSAMVSIMDYASMFMEINLPESAINDVKVGQVVDITHYTLPYDTLKGIVSELSPAISTETRTFKGKLTIDNSKLLLRAGMFVKADIVVERVESAIVIPKDIIMSNRRNKFVYVVERNTAVRRFVETGIEDEDNIQIVSGLSVGDNLVTRGYETLRDNAKVKIQNQN